MCVRVQPECAGNMAQLRADGDTSVARRNDFRLPESQIHETMAEHAAMPQGVQIVTLEPSDFPRLCCEPHLLESWRIHLPR